MNASAAPCAPLAVWALTPAGAELAQRLAARCGNARLLLPARMDHDGPAERFDRLADAVTRRFDTFSGHVFIMAVGIVVRLVAPLARHKASDPAVVVMDEAGRWAISLLSGHLGGANDLARWVAEMTGAQAVITTATDAGGITAIDTVARQRGLAVANTEAIAAVNMALLQGVVPEISDPDRWLAGWQPPASAPSSAGAGSRPRPAVVVTDTALAGDTHTLVLHPPSLAVGIGCRRQTSAVEILRTVRGVFASHNLAEASIFALASADIKADEPGLLAAADDLGASLKLFSKHELNRLADRLAPSAAAKRHLGVWNVCEAAAILAAGNGRLVVSKHKTERVTVAVARRTCPS